MVTVLMAVYNGGNYLKEAIESVLNQTYKDFEFLIVDDCSTDNTCGIIQGYSDSRIRLYKNSQNIQQTASLNIGLGIARGEYIARIDADDIASPRWLESHMNYLQKHPECEVVSSDALVIDEYGRQKRILNISRDQENMTVRSLVATPIHHGGCLMEADMILKYGKYNENFKIAFDYELWSRLLRKGVCFGAHRYVGMKVRFHAQSTSLEERKSRDLPDMVQVMADNVHYYTTVCLDEATQALYWRLCYDVEVLSDGEFDRGIRLIENIYHSLRPEFNHLTHAAKAYLDDQKKIILVKRIFGLARQQRMAQIRFLCWCYIQKRGIFNVFGLMAVASLLRNSGIQFLRQCYYFFQKLKVRMC